MNPTTGDRGNDIYQETPISDPKTEPLGTAPTLLQVFILPADESRPRILYLPTIDTSTEPPFSPASLEHRPQQPTNEPELLMAALQATFARAEYRPAVRIFPDPRQGGYWSADSWTYRTVMKTGRWHFLFTQPREGLPPNPWTSGLFFGHVFVMKFLGTVDPDGEQSYRDILPDAATSDHEEYFLDKFATGILGGLARALAPILAQ